MMNTMRTTALATALAIAAAMACYPAVAHADDASFLAAVQAAGQLSADDTPAVMLALGHQICDDITAHGVAGVADSMGLAQKAGVTPQDAGRMLRFSVDYLCPDNQAAADAWADADVAGFLQAARNTGLMTPNPNDVLVVGYEICAEITANGVAGVANAEARGHTAEVNSGMPMGTSGTMIRISVYNLCPNNTPAMDAWINENPQEPQTEPALPTVSDNPPQAQTAPTLGDAAGHAVPQPTLGHAEHV
jgi:hypothetical protein